MGLAPYGRPAYVERLETVLHEDGDGQYRLDLRFFDFLSGTEMFSPLLSDLLGHPPCRPGATPDRFAVDLASSAQALLERVLLSKARYLHSRVRERRLAVAGGVALNCAANGRLLIEGPFEDVFVQPAAGDAGGALGAAAIASRRLDEGCRPGRMEHVFLGPEYSCQEIVRILQGGGCKFEHFHNARPALTTAVAGLIAEGKVVGWFQGRMEFGPRALGSRSILADPRDAESRERINRRVKRRESFRPFAPAVKIEDARQYFELSGASPFMLFTTRVRQPSGLPAVTHVDGSARIQTVDRAQAPLFHDLLTAFEGLTGCPVLLNTSFNFRNEPIVCTPVDAIGSFLACGLDALVMEDVLVTRDDVPAHWLRYAARPRSGEIGEREAPNVYSLL